MLRVINEIKPDWVVEENVDGIIGLALDDVLSDLEGKNYETGAFVLPACGVGAPHRRYRVAIIAHRNGVSGDARGSESTGQQREAGPANGRDDVGHAKYNGSSSTKIRAIDSKNASWFEEGKKPSLKSSGAGIAGCSDDVADAAREQDWRLQRCRILTDAGRSGENVADAAGERRDRPVPARRRGARPADPHGYALADETFTLTSISQHTIIRLKGNTDSEPVYLLRAEISAATRSYLSIHTNDEELRVVGLLSEAETLLIDTGRLTAKVTDADGETLRNGLPCLQELNFPILRKGSNVIRIDTAGEALFSELSIQAMSRWR